MSSRKPRVPVVLALALLLCATAVFFASCGDTEDSEPPVEISTPSNYVPGELIVKFKSDTSQQEIDDVIEDSGGESVIETIGPEENNTFLIKLEADLSVEEAISKFISHQQVEYAEPNYRYSIQE